MWLKRLSGRPPFGGSVVRFYASKCRRAGCLTPHRSRWLPSRQRMNGYCCWWAAGDLHLSLCHQWVNGWMLTGARKNFEWSARQEKVLYKYSPDTIYDIKHFSSQQDTSMLNYYIITWTFHFVYLRFSFFLSYLVYCLYCYNVKCYIITLYRETCYFPKILAIPLLHETIPVITQ